MHDAKRSTNKKQLFSCYESFRTYFEESRIFESKSGYPQSRFYPFLLTWKVVRILRRPFFGSLCKSGSLFYFFVWPSTRKGLSTIPTYVPVTSLLIFATGRQGRLTQGNDVGTTTVSIVVTEIKVSQALIFLLILDHDKED